MTDKPVRKPRMAQPTPGRTKYPSSFRLSPDAMATLDRLAAELGISNTAVLEMAIRRLAKEQGVKG